mmetsp:Transcript_57713/g.161898  ORF Transcript_57713/g.161898 Transcript_57713/m.161898 type:complete len:335 (+) Transcript_57713:265-1269(+)
MSIQPSAVAPSIGRPNSCLILAMSWKGTALWRRSRYSRFLPSGEVKSCAKALTPFVCSSFWARPKRCRRPLFFFTASTSAAAPSGPRELPLSSMKRSAWFVASAAQRLFAAPSSRRLYWRLKCSSVGCDFSGPSLRAAAPLSPRRHPAKQSDFTDLFFARPAQNSPSTPSASQMLLLKITFSSDLLPPKMPPTAFIPFAPKRARGIRRVFRFLPTCCPSFVLLLRPVMSHWHPSSPMLLSERFNSSKVITASLSSSFSKSERMACEPYLEAQAWSEVCGLSIFCRSRTFWPTSRTSRAPRAVGMLTGSIGAAAAMLRRGPGLSRVLLGFAVKMA